MVGRGESHGGGGGEREAEWMQMKSRPSENKTSLIEI